MDKFDKNMIFLVCQLRIAHVEGRIYFSNTP